MASIHPAQLRCEYQESPIGIDAQRPRLSWVPQATSEVARGCAQRGYRVLVASSLERLQGDDGELWDSGRVASDETAHIVYGGQRPASRQRCFWKVKLWDESDQETEWSEAAWWEMGLLDADDWKAEWIEVPFDLTPEMPPGLPPAPMFRRTFEITSDVVRARVYVSALGLYELHLNGQRVGRNVLAPEWTDYHKRVQYQSFDVTELLQRGENVLGAMCAEGWYAGRIGFWREQGQYGSYRPRFIAQLEMHYPDGHIAHVVTDGSWHGTIEGPIRNASLLDGEIYDARREMSGWDRPGYQELDWTGVRSVPELSEIRRVSQSNEAIQVVQQIEPKSVTEVKPGTYVFDLGQNMAGWCRLRVSGAAGQIVNLRHAEVLNPDGSIYTDNLRVGVYNGSPGPHHGIYGWMLGARQTDTFILSGRGEETFEPRFTYHGFRYVEVTGLREKPGLDSLTGFAVSSAVPQCGIFQSSSAFLNKLMASIVWTHRSNLHSVPTDCPQRDERLGWLGDAQVFAHASCFNANMVRFYTKWLQDIRDAQWDNGRFPDFAPNPLGQKRPIGAPGWADAGILIPWCVYEHYGDRQVLADQYQSAKRHVESVLQYNPDLIWRNQVGNNYGDHLNVDTTTVQDWPEGGARTPGDVFATIYFAHSVRLLSRMAKVTGHLAEAGRYAQLADQIQTAFQREFVAPDGRIKGDTQTAYALALHFGLVPASLRKAALHHLVEKLAAYGWRLSTGIHGTNRLMLELVQGGHADIAYRLLDNRSIPSWGYMIEHGATTIWERWDSITDELGFQDRKMNSFNHYALGAIGEWLYRVVGGLNPDPEQPGFRNTIVRPIPGGGLTWAKVAYTSIRGRIATAWCLRNGAFELELTVPPNTTATVYVPARDRASVTEQGRPLEEAIGVRYLRTEEGAVVVAVQSGTYRFCSESPLLAS